MPRGNGHRGHRQGQPPPPNLAPCTPLSTHVPTQWPWRGRYDVFGNIPTYFLCAESIQATERPPTTERDTHAPFAVLPRTPPF